MEERKTESISYQAWRIYALDPAKTAGLLALVFTITLLSLAIGVFLGGAFVFFFLLLSVPAFFAAFLLLFTLKKQGGFSLGMFPRAYAAYFESPFRGVLRAIPSFFKSLLVFFLSVISVLFVYYFLSPNFDPAFQDALKELVAAYESQDFTLFANMLNENSSIVFFYRVLYPIAYGVSALFLFHFLFMGGIEISGRADVPQVVAEGTTVRVFANAARTIRRNRAKEYWKACWFLPIVFALGFGIGVVIGSQISATNTMVPSIIGFALGCLAYLFFLPYHGEVQRLLMSEWEKEIYSLAAKMMREVLVQASASHALDAKGSALFLQRLERLEKALEEGNYREILGQEPSEPEDPYE